MKHLTRILALGSAVLLALPACRDAPPPAGPVPAVATVPAAPAASAPLSASAALAEPPAPVPSTAGHRVQVQGVLEPGGATWRFTLHADAPPAANQMLHVQAIEIEPPEGAGGVQRIDGLDTQTPVIPGVPLLELLDMNFDGHADLRLAESRPAGPNTPFLNWLFDPASQRFLPSPALDALNGPVFDAQKRHVVDRWRDGAARYGTDTYVWRDGHLVAVNPKPGAAKSKP